MIPTLWKCWKPNMDEFQPQSTVQAKHGYHEADFSIRAVVVFAVFLAISAVMSFLAVGGMMKFMETWAKDHEPRLAPLEEQLRVQRQGVKPAPLGSSREKDEE